MNVSPSETTIAPRRLSLTVGPVQYWWPRQRLIAFYAQVADGPADAVVLGEVVCSRRNEIKVEDWLALGRDLAAAGKQVVLATQILVMGEGELRTLRRVCEQSEFAVEAGDASALRILARAFEHQPLQRPFVLGPHINIYSREALEEHAQLGAGRWVVPLELGISAAGAINPPDAPVAGPAGPVATEVFAFGRLPLSFSARCFTARHYRLSKDTCAFRCREHPDGLPLTSTDGDAFLTLNGTQMQSAGVQCLLGEGAALRAAGAAGVRLSPCSHGFDRIVTGFDAVLNRGADAAAMLDDFTGLGLAGALVNGYARRRPGMEWIDDEPREAC